MTTKMLVEFDNYIEKINIFLRLIGFSINRYDIRRTTFERLMFHWKYFILSFFFNLAIIGEIIWLVLGIANGKSLLQITFLIPCLTLCVLGDFKVNSFIYHVHSVINLIDSLRKLQSTDSKVKEKIKEEIMKPWLKFLTNVFNLLLFLDAAGVTLFILGPLIIMASYYYTFGEVKLFLPFLVWYPFDSLNIRYWPIAYFHQMLSAWVAVLTVYGPDCFFFTCCTFIHTQFIFLQRDMEQVIEKDSWKHDKVKRNYEFKKTFVQLVNRHRELIRCMALLDSIYSKSTLFNVVTSSLIICATGFNLMAFKNYILMAPFCSFLLFGLLQVFFYSYYGDYVMRSSAGVSDAIYNSRWYEAGAIERRSLFIVLVRSQKPCKFTAYRFADINLATFTRILSTSWSYFALLNQIYQD